MDSKYIKFIILAIEIIFAAIVTKFFQNMVYTDIILMILTLGISFYIALHYEYEIKQEKKWVEFEKKIFEMLESEKTEKREAYNQIYLDMKKNREETETWIKNLFKINKLKID